MADEHDIANAVIAIANAQPSRICTFKRAYRDIPSHIALDANNLAASPTRRGEPMWHQLVRNIKCHDNAPGNAIYDGRLIHVPRVGYQVP